MINYLVIESIILFIIIILICTILKSNEYFTNTNSNQITFYGNDPIDKEYAKEYCRLWYKNPGINPVTNKEIEIGKSSFNELKKYCSDPNLNTSNEPKIIRLLDDLTVNNNNKPPIEYDRRYFTDWNIYSDKCSTRDNVLARQIKKDLVLGNYDQNKDKCKLDSTLIIDNTYIKNKNVTQTPQLLIDKAQIDHTVPLENAWISGAYKWTPWQLKAYSNDMTPGHLVAMSDNLNSGKQSKTPLQWMPPGTDVKMRCNYLADWIAIKHRWDLSVTNGEKIFLLNELQKCPSNIKPKTTTREKGYSLKQSLEYPDRFNMTFFTNQEISERKDLYNKYNNNCNDSNFINSNKNDIIDDFNYYSDLYGIYNPNSPYNSEKYKEVEEKCKLLASPLPEYLK
jgi:hypothetical protein